MSKATPFKALAAGNGFTSILGRVDVSQFDNYAALSLEQAMMLYWNLLSVTSGLLTASMSTSNREGGSDSLNKSKSTQLFTITPEPKERIEKSRGIIPGGNFSAGMTQNEEANFFRVGSAGGNGSVSIPTISKLYDGVTTNENNFVGYGVERIYIATAAASVDEITSCSAEITIGSFLDGEDEVSTTTHEGSGVKTITKQNAGVVNIGGMTFRSFTKVMSFGLKDHISPTLQATQSTASVSDSFTITSTQEDGTTSSSSHSCSAKLTAPDLGFYSYQSE